MKKPQRSIFTCLIQHEKLGPLISSYHYTEEEAITYAKRHPGVIRVDVLDSEPTRTIWTRPPEPTEN